MIKLSNHLISQNKITFIPAISVDSKMYDAFNVFKTFKKYSFFPVVNKSGIPEGIIAENSIKDYIFAPYGRELLLHRYTKDFLTECPVIGMNCDTDEIMKAFSQKTNPFGLIAVDDQGYYKGVLLADAIMELYEENRVEINNQLLHAQKLEALGLLAGGIAHDFNNLLVPILGFSELAKEKIQPSDDVLMKYLNKISGAAIKAKDLIEQILLFHRKNESEPMQLHLTPLIKEIVKFLIASVNSNVSVRFDIQIENDSALINPDRIKQVIMNLCTNAVHAMNPDGGTLTISLQKFEKVRGWTYYKYQQDSEYIQLTISDTGRGIEKQLLPRIFEPYFTTKKQHEGSGLGLSVVLGIIKSINGFISIETEPGAGTSFHVMIPVVEKVEALKIEHTSSRLKNDKKILIVDDDESVLEVITAILEDNNYRVAGFSKCSEALEHFSKYKQEYSAIITDMSMPEMNGLQLVKKLRILSPSIPILLCSGYTEKEGVTNENSYVHGINKILSKPFTIETLLYELNNLIE